MTQNRINHIAVEFDSIISDPIMLATPVTVAGEIEGLSNNTTGLLVKATTFDVSSKGTCIEERYEVVLKNFSDGSESEVEMNEDDLLNVMGEAGSYLRSKYEF